MICATLFVVVAIARTLGSAAEEPDVPPGMEVIEINQAKFLVPVGTKVSKKNDLYVLERIEEYVARRMVLMEERVAALEKEYRELKKEQEKLNRLMPELLNATQADSRKKATN